jgi:hypothetical protein
MLLSLRIRTVVAIAVALCLTASNIAHATADGPDFYKVLKTQDGSAVPLRAKPGASESVGTLPEEATCVRNKGCQGGLTLQEFITLSAQQKSERLVANPRWCAVEYQGLTGWVEGSLLAEAPCASQDARARLLTVRSKALTVTGVIKGDQSTDYRIRALAGQTLKLALLPKHTQANFNVRWSGSQESMFIGSTSGQVAEVLIPADGVYTVQVYLMRAAARRGASSNFSLSASLQGQALPARDESIDALVSGTPFHATATVKCTPPYTANPVACDAGVIRRGFDGTATVELRWPQGVRHILFVAGKAVASDSAQALSSAKKGDTNHVTIGSDETFDIPDALLTGG